MALSQLYSAIAGDVITAARWNNEFGNIYTNGTDIPFPATKAVSFAGFTITLDASGFTSLGSPATTGFLFTVGSKSGTPSASGSLGSFTTSTFTDTATAAAGTASLWTGLSVRTPTLAATNAVTTTQAATVYIEDAPTAGTNQTLTDSLALLVAAGKSKFQGNVEHTGTVTVTGKSLWLAESAAVASDGSGTTNVWTTDGNTVHITGTNAITSLGTAPQAGAFKLVIFDDALTLTHGANLNIPGAANVTTVAGDSCLVYADSTTQFDILYYTRASGLPFVAPSAAQGSALVFIEALTASASASLVFDDLGSTYDEHIFQCINIVPASNGVTFTGTVSIDNGSAYANSNYVTIVNDATSGETTAWVFAASQTNNAARSFSGTIRLFKPHATAIAKQMLFDAMFVSSAFENWHGGGGCVDAAPDVVANAINAIKFAYSSGNIASGTIRHYGIKNS